MQRRRELWERYQDWAEAILDDLDEQMHGNQSIRPSGEKGLTTVIGTYTYIAKMRTSCRFAMAVHVLAVLAYKEGDRVTSAYLASSVNTNPVTVRQLLLSLQKAGMVDTRKGAGSGSRLERAPARINLAEVFKAVEADEPFVLPRRKPNEDCPVGQCIQEEMERVFASAEQELVRELGRTTIADVVSAARRKCARAATVG